MTHDPDHPTAPPPTAAPDRPGELTPQALVARIAELTGLSAEQSEDALTALLSSAAQELQVRRETVLPGLGTFTVRERPGGGVHVTFRLSAAFRAELALTPAPGGVGDRVSTLRPIKVKS